MPKSLSKLDDWKSSESVNSSKLECSEDQSSGSIKKEKKNKGLKAISASALKSMKPSRKVPNSLFAWEWFKKHFLANEERRILLINSSLSKQEFIDCIKRIISFPSELPSYCRIRGGSRTAETVTRSRSKLLNLCYSWYLQSLHKDSEFYVAPSLNKGVGIFSRNNKSIQSMKPLVINGELCHLEEITLSNFLEQNHPSIYNESILYGLVSLINHSCLSNFRFKGRKNLKVQNVGEKSQKILKDEEILVNYFDDEKCKFTECPKCSNLTEKNKL